MNQASGAATAYEDQIPTEEVESWVAPVIIVASIALWLGYCQLRPQPDVAWLIEGARRWVHGATLYIDVRELNPPLIFYDTVLLTGGLTSYRPFVAGVMIATALSSLWVARHRGSALGLGTFISINFAGMIEFGQREHLLLVFVVPYLVARGSNSERAAMGLWAFLGVALKPYFLFVVIFPALVEAWRNWKSLFEAQKIALGAACAAYLAAAWLLHPAYFRDMIPLAREAYIFSIGLPPLMVLQTLILIYPIAMSGADRRPFAAAVAGALASYYVQYRFFGYHFIAAAGLGMILCFWMGRLNFFAALILLQAFRGPSSSPSMPVPEGVKRVAVLSSFTSDPYPAVTGCGAINVTRYGSIGWVHKSWNVLTDPTRSEAERRHARALLAREREWLRRDILANDTQVIIVDARARKAFFDRPFDFMEFIGPFPGYHLVHREKDFTYWAKAPISGKMCKERY